MCRYTTKRLLIGRSKIVEKSILNQLAPIVDNIAASISRLEAELEYTNAEINIMYAPYTILKETGKI